MTGLEVSVRMVFLVALVACGGGSTGDSGTAGTSPGTTSGTPTGTGSTTSWTPDGEWVRADDAGPDQMLGGADIAIAPDGTMVVSWVDGRGTDDDVRISRSDDGGATWSASVVVDGPEEPIVDWWSGPGLVTDGNTVLLTSPARVPEIRGFSWQASLSDLQFGPGTQWGGGLVEMISGTLGPAGDVQVAWLQYGGGVDVRLATGSTGPDGVSLNSGLGTPSCECCPIDLLTTSDGRTLASWRDNANNVRNIAVASGPANSLPDTAVVATSTDWLVLSCPVQGGRFAEAADGRIFLTWSDASSGTSTVYVVDSADGVSWSAERVVSPSGGLQQSPRIAVGPSGTVWLAYSEAQAYYLTSSPDGGQSWNAPVALVTDAGPVERADLAAGAGQVWLEGEAGGGVWLQRIE